MPPETDTTTVNELIRIILNSGNTIALDTGGDGFHVDSTSADDSRITYRTPIDDKRHAQQDMIALILTSLGWRVARRGVGGAVYTWKDDSQHLMCTNVQHTGPSYPAIAYVPEGTAIDDDGHYSCYRCIYGND